MFIKELWTYSKTATFVFLFFICLWGYLNYKQGAVASPLFQYGMYSGKFFVTDTQKVVRLYANGQAVDFTKYSMAGRDLLQTSLEYYMGEKVTNETVFYTMKRILDKAGIGRFMIKDRYTNCITDKAFTQWYIHLTEKIIAHPVNKLEVYEQEYIWKGDHLMPVTNPFKIGCIVPNQ